jgi:hypothetical protein
MRWILTVAAALMLAGSATAYVNQLDSAAGTIDTLRPTATLSLDDPATTALDAVHIRADFSEYVSPTFGTGNVKLTGSLSTAATFAVSGTDPNYSVTITLNNPEDDGTIGIQIDTAVTDVPGNAYAGGTSSTYHIHNWHGFTLQPDPANLYTGDSGTLKVTASYGDSTPAYQWKFDNGASTQNVGTNSTTYDITGVALTQKGTYWCAASYDGVVHESDHVLVDVADPLAVTMIDPATVRVYTSENHSLQATVAGGFLPLDQQWTKGGSDIPGEKGTAYAITGAGPGNVGTYALRVTDRLSTTRTSAAAEVLVADHLQITADPAATEKAVGTSYTFTVGISGGFPTLSYLWKRNGNDVPDGTDSQLPIASIVPEDEGNYTVEVRDAGGDVKTSQPALLHVVGPLAIQKDPQGVHAYAGDSQVFTVETSGGVLPLSYEWRKNGNPISAPSLRSYTIASVDASHVGNYSVVVTDHDSASQTSGDGALAVTAHLRIEDAPSGGQEVVGARHTFTVTTTGGYQPLTFVWKKNGGEIAGATTASYTTPTLTLSDSATFKVEITDAYGDSQTATANLTVVRGVPVMSIAGLGGLFGLIIVSGARRIRKK